MDVASGFDRNPGISFIYKTFISNFRYRVVESSSLVVFSHPFISFFFSFKN